MSVTAGVVHVLLWYWNDVKFMFTWMKPSALKERAKSFELRRFWTKSEKIETFPGTEGDPHFEAMRAYEESKRSPQIPKLPSASDWKLTYHLITAPAWWYHATLVLAIVIGLICCYQQKTGLPWWAFLIAVGLAWFLTLIYACLFGISGFYYAPYTAVQMIGAYLVPGKPVANMMFTLYGSNSLRQALLMLQDLKLSQYAKLPPRATFTAQIIGSCVGCIMNWVMMNSIVKNQRPVLLSVEGTSLWSGQNIQSYNSQAIAWGGAGKVMFGRDGTYWQVPMALFYGIFVPIRKWSFLFFDFAHRYLWKHVNSNISDRTFARISLLGGS